MPDASAPDERSSPAPAASGAREAAAREAFAVVASHALRGVTHSIAGSLALLSMQEPGETFSPRQRSLVQGASAATGRLLQLSDDLQTLTHAAGQTLQPRREPLALTTLLREAIAQASATASSQPPREITPRVLPGAALALGDPALARRALAALIENALRFSPQQTPVTVEARKRGQHAIIRVHDTGADLISTDVERLFAPLVSGADPKSHFGVGLGLGLGLAVARACAEAQQGRVWLERATDKGATFALELPLATAADMGADEGTPSR
jgi:signal transduction histidine kinase